MAIDFFQIAYDAVKTVFPQIPQPVSLRSLHSFVIDATVLPGIKIRLAFALKVQKLFIGNAASMTFGELVDKIEYYYGRVSVDNK